MYHVKPTSKSSDLPNTTYFQALKFPNSVGMVPAVVAALLFVPCFPATEIPPSITQQYI